MRHMRAAAAGLALLLALVSCSADQDDTLPSDHFGSEAQRDELAEADSADEDTHPMLMGFDGSRFQYNSPPGKFFNLLSDEVTQVNALLVKDPATNRTLIGAIGLITGLTRVKILALSSDAKMVVEVNDMVLKAQEKLFRLHNGLALKYQKHDLKQEVDVRTFNYVFSIRLHKGAFLDLRRVLMMRRPMDIHGVLGQTARAGRPQKKDGYLEGVESDYWVSGLWAGDFAHNRYDTEIAQMVSDSMTDDGPTLANRIYDIDGHRKKWRQRESRRIARAAERQAIADREGGLEEVETDAEAEAKSLKALGGLLGKPGGRKLASMETQH